MPAAIRPDDVNLALLVHVLGAMVLVGGLLTATTAGLVGWRDDEAGVLARLAYRTLLFVAFPAYVVMRLAAEWVYHQENLDVVADEPAWIGIGYLTADLGGVLLLVALVLGGIGLRRNRGGLLKAAAVLATLLVAVYVVAVWAMGAKPT